MFMLYREEHFQKELAPNEVIVLGSVTDVNSEQPSKQLFGILVIEPKLEILCIFAFANEYWFIVVSSGRLSVEITNLEQLRSADWPNDVILDQSMSTVVRLLQSSNALSPMVDTLPNPVIEVNDEQDWNMACFTFVKLPENDKDVNKEHP